MSSTIYNRLNLNSSSPSVNKDYVRFTAGLFHNRRAISIRIKLTSDINTTTNNGLYSILSRFISSGTPNGFILRFEAGKIRLLYYNGGYFGVNSDNNSWTSGQVVDITIVYGATGKLMYIDGVLQTEVGSGSGNTGVIASDTSIGGIFNLDTQWGFFIASNLQIWDNALTSTEINNLIGVIPDVSATGLVECFPFADETGATTTGIKGNTGTINTSNVGGTTYIDSTIREDYTFDPIPPDPSGNEFLQKQILKATNQLYPTGRAFNMLNGTELSNLHKALIKSESLAFENAKGILNHILPDNDGFGTDDAALWENRLGLITNTAVSLADRKLAIQRKMNQPGEYPAKQSAGYLEEQLQAAGFTVYVHENIPETDIYDFLITNNTVRFGPNRMGTFRYNSTVPNYNSLFDVIRMNTVRMGAVRFNQKVYLNKVANHIEEYKDAYFPIYDNFRSTFFIGGITKGDFANVPLARKEEFRQLILKIKPVQTIGYLLINYI